MADQADGQHELIFVGTVESVGPPPPHWSGMLPAYQEVHYRVDQAIKGETGPQMVAIHPVVRDSPTAEPGNVPRLSCQLFHCGATLLVMGVAHSGGLCCVASEHFGAMPYSRLLVERMRAAIGPR
jgi:hypothetical protein